MNVTRQYAGVCRVRRICLVVSLILQLPSDVHVCRSLFAGPGNIAGKARITASSEMGEQGKAANIIDGISRIDDGRAKIHGWAAEIGGTGAPLTILVFIDGSTVLATKTAGERPEVARELKLSPQAARNVAFEGTLLAANARD